MAPTKPSLWLGGYTISMLSFQNDSITYQTLTVLLDPTTNKFVKYCTYVPGAASRSHHTKFVTLKLPDRLLFELDVGGGGASVIWLCSSEDHTLKFEL